MTCLPYRQPNGMPSPLTASIRSGSWEFGNEVLQASQLPIRTRIWLTKALAVWGLRNNPGWTKERVAEAFAAGKEQQVNLTRTIPVLVVYASAVVEEDGQVFIFEDIYGHDKALAKLEAQAYSSSN